MTNFTQKQQAYIDARVSGLNRTQSAIHAGYSPAGADRQGSALELRGDIKAAIAKAKKSVKKNGGGKPVIDEDEPRMLPKYGSSLELLQHTYNNPRMPDSVRMRAAEQALPYEHGRVGEQGKKEKKQERAHAVANGSGKRSKFGPKQAPALHLVK